MESIGFLPPIFPFYLSFLYFLFLNFWSVNNLFPERKQKRSKSAGGCEGGGCVGGGGGCDLCGVNYFHLKLFDPVDYLKLEGILTEKQLF